MSRLAATFERCRKAGRAALITYIVAGDPDMKTSTDLLHALPEAGSDIIELGMAFSDPMADGPIIQEAANRALRSGASIRRTLGMVKDFRKNDSATPIVLMGYANPIYAYGLEAFVRDAAKAGTDGLIVVDIPLEEEEDLSNLASKYHLDLIRLVAPTTSESRIARIAQRASGFIYYISVTGVTGAKSPDFQSVDDDILRCRRYTSLPLAVGFGVKTQEQAAQMANIADGVVVGSALIATITQHLGNPGKIKQAVVEQVRGLATSLYKAK